MRRMRLRNGCRSAARVSAEREEDARLADIVTRLVKTREP
jgi:hypothetical protein